MTSLIALVEQLKNAEENRAIINEKIKMKKMYASREQNLIWIRQRRYVVKLIKEIKTKIDLHPDTKYK